MGYWTALDSNYQKARFIINAISIVLIFVGIIIILFAVYLTGKKTPDPKIPNDTVDNSAYINELIAGSCILAFGTVCLAFSLYFFYRKKKLLNTNIEA